MYNQAYNYNPYMQPQYNRMEQPINNYPQIQSPVMSAQRPVMSGLNGKLVESMDVVKAIDIPMDGSISYYPLSDGTAIITKQLQIDGTSKIVTYKRLIEEEKEESRYITVADFDVLHNEIKELKDLMKKGDENNE